MSVRLQVDTDYYNRVVSSAVCEDEIPVAGMAPELWNPQLCYEVRTMIQYRVHAKVKKVCNYAILAHDRQACKETLAPQNSAYFYFVCPTQS